MDGGGWLCGFIIRDFFWIVGRLQEVGQEGLVWATRKVNKGFVMLKEIGG